MISLQARIVKALCRFFVKRPQSKPSPDPVEGIRQLRRSTSLWNASYRGLTRGLRVRSVRSPVPGEWLLPDEGAPERAILYVHGGGFVACSPLTHRSLTTALAREAGIPLFSVDYRLAPEDTFPGRSTTHSPRSTRS